MSESKSYEIEVEFTFKGTFTVKAKSEDQAKSLVDDACGLTLGEVHSSLPCDEVDWNFPIHGEKTFVEE